MKGYITKVEVYMQDIVVFDCHAVVQYMYVIVIATCATCTVHVPIQSIKCMNTV